MRNIILCSSFAGQLKKGVKNFPSFAKSIINPKYKIIDAGLDNENNIFKNSQKIYDTCSQHAKPINIGGDHSITIATGASSLNEHKDVKFIWIDAHTDINTYESSTTKNYHGMPLSFLTGIDKNHSFSFIKNYLPFENLYYIGIRDVDPYEWRVLSTRKINYAVACEVNKNPMVFYRRLSKFIDGAPIHISFDVDALDPSYISSTGTPVPKGLEMYATKFILDNLLKHENVVGMDIVEMNLDINTENSNESVQNLKYLLPSVFI